MRVRRSPRHKSSPWSFAMESWRTVVVVVAVITAATCTPLINKLEPGKEWPARQSVDQPSNQGKPVNPENGQINKEKTDVKVEDVPAEVPATEAATEAVAEETEDEAIASKAVDLTKNEITKVDYTGAQLWKISTEKQGVRAVIGRLRRRNLISTWGGNHSNIDILVKPNAVQNVTRAFKRENISYDVIIDDLQKRIDEENPPLDENELQLQDRRARAYNFWRYRAPHRRLGLIGAYMGYNSLNLPMEYWPSANWGHKMTWKQYHRLEDIHQFLDYLGKTYPSIISVKSIGKSFEGRDLKVLRISNGNAKNKAVWIDGGIHAREWISPATVTYFINQFAENFDVESEDIKNIDWYIMPVINPDGYEFTHVGDRLWRKNRKPGGTTRVCAGTDLNRNFGYRWGGKGASNNPCSEIYRGSKAFSEPETKAVADFIKSSATNFSAYLSYHSYGQYLLYPWGYDSVVPPDYQELDALGKSMAQAIKNTGGSEYSVGSSSGLLYPAAGGSDDWAKAQGIKYAYTVELSDTGRYGFVLPVSFIEPVARESLAGLRVLAAAVNKL